MPKMYHGDCLKLMQKIPEHSVDLILCDLPYGTSDRTGIRNKGANRLYEWDCEIDLDALWAHYKRVLAADGNVVLTADQPFTAKLIMSNLEWFKYDLIWDKCRVNGFLHANSRPMKQTEDIVVFSPLGAAPAARVNGRHMKYNPQGLLPVSIKKTNSASASATSCTRRRTWARTANCSAAATTSRSSPTTRRKSCALRWTSACTRRKSRSR